ncbi:MAG: DUF2306 domain-containing protein [Alphaproteobacteria bacterium]|nr:DUF2306 domain-containing protein [Alphaproteobacteria bacterium]
MSGGELTVVVEGARPEMRDDPESQRRCGPWFPWRSKTGILIVLGLGGVLVAYVGILIPVAWTGLELSLDGSTLPYPLAVILDRLPRVFPVHMAASALALALVPLAVLAWRWPRWHRPLGRLAALCVVTGGIAALAVALNSVATWSARLGFVAQAVTWLGTLGLGLWCIRQHNVKGHAGWMAQMVVLTLSPVLLRLMAAVVVMNRPRDFDFYYAVIAWVCWLVPLLMLRLWLWWRASRAIRVAAVAG